MIMTTKMSPRGAEDRYTGWWYVTTEDYCEGETALDKNVERKLEEAYQHMIPYMDKECAPELFDMCTNCERWMGKGHDYKVCRARPCFINWLGLAYLQWETNAQ